MLIPRWRDGRETGISVEIQDHRTGHPPQHQRGRLHLVGASFTWSIGSSIDHAKSGGTRVLIPSDQPPIDSLDPGSGSRWPARRGGNRNGLDFSWPGGKREEDKLQVSRTVTPKLKGRPKRDVHRMTWPQHYRLGPSAVHIEVWVDRYAIQSAEATDHEPDLGDCPMRDRGTDHARREPTVGEAAARQGRPRAEWPSRPGPCNQRPRADARHTNMERSLWRNLGPDLPFPKTACR